MYFPTLPKSMHALMHRVDGAIDKRTATFIDVGCGKGIALLVASQYAFAKIIGVEFSSDLAEVARKNVRNYRGPRVTRNIDVHCMDATDFEFPAGPLLVYFFNPFDKPVMERVLQNLTASLNSSPREAIVICDRLHDRDLVSEYLRPGQRDVFLGFSIYSGLNPVVARSSSAA
jgi:SAM-dependent methyltransferase